VAYRIEFTPEALGHFAALDARQRAIVRDALRAQLLHQPALETRHRRRDLKVRNRVMIGSEEIDLT
jgi:hypothetical protein